MHQHALAAAGVEACILEGQGEGIGERELDRQCVPLAPQPRNVDHRLADVDADDAALRADDTRELAGVVARSAAEVEDVCVLR